VISAARPDKSPAMSPPEAAPYLAVARGQAHPR